jgi:hypothetical protein
METQLSAVVQTPGKAFLVGYFILKKKNQPIQIAPQMMIFMYA